MIKKGDNVVISTGKDKGKKGKVLKVFPSDRKVIVEGVNLSKKRQKPRKGGQKGQVMDKPMPFDMSNVKVFCARCDKGVRAGTKITGATKKRVCQGCKVEI
jgi:large subunit ribosomal protein L24